ncbi:MAG: acetyltransferase [Bacteroidales bacterium]|nr:acetyltransferase [Bacteroidales bacterium]
MSTKKDIILIGGGGHCRSVIEVIESGKEFNIVGIVDQKEKLGEKISSYEMKWTDEDLMELVSKGYSFHISIGQIKTVDLRCKIFDFLIKNDANMPVIVAANASVSSRAKIASGTIIMQGAIVNANAEIGKNCIINSKALIEHDAKIGDFCHISTGAIINGAACVGEKSFIGSAAVLIQESIVPPESFVRAASLIK